MGDEVLTPKDVAALRCLDPRYPGLCLLGKEQGHDHREAEMIRRGYAERVGDWVVLSEAGRAALRRTIVCPACETTTCGCRRCGEPCTRCDCRDSSEADRC